MRSLCYVSVVIQEQDSLLHFRGRMNQEKVSAKCYVFSFLVSTKSTLLFRGFIKIKNEDQPK